MILEYKGLKVHYDVWGQGDRLVILHGWDGAEIWNNYVNQFLGLGLQVIVLHFPGFGESEIPDGVVDSYYYADVVKALFEELELEGSVVLGHSMGGKVATIFQTKYNLASKLILVDSAGYKRFYFTVFLKVLAAKIGKFFLGILGGFGKDSERREKLLTLAGSVDYLMAGEMRESFRKIIGEDIRDLFSKIKIPTLIIWGDQDLETPLIDGVQMSREIKNSSLKIIRNSGHFPFVTNTSIFFNLIRDFVGK